MAGAAYILRIVQSIETFYIVSIMLAENSSLVKKGGKVKSLGDKGKLRGVKNEVQSLSCKALGGALKNLILAPASHFLSV